MLDGCGRKRDRTAVTGPDCGAVEPWGDRMDAPDQRYWSVEECRWVKLPAREALYGEIYADVPAQRVDEPAQEPVEA